MLYDHLYPGPKRHNVQVGTWTHNTVYMYVFVPNIIPFVYILHLPCTDQKPSDSVIFDTDICAAKAMFNRARLYVSPHGALCVNMIFMPFGGHMFEMRPRGYPNPCFHHMAEVCELQYYLVMGNGTKQTNIGVEMSVVKTTLELIKDRMMKEEMEILN